jgi:predicted membrane chloride channel (bestrophin family)
MSLFPDGDTSVLELDQQYVKNMSKLTHQTTIHGEIIQQPPPPTPTINNRPRKKSRPQLRARYKFGHRCCGCCPIPECCLPLKFVLGLLNCRGTVMMRALPQIIMAMIWGACIKIWYLQQPFAVPGVFWAPLYSVTIFLGVFRTNLAFQQYKEGRCNLGKMVDSLTSAVRFSVSIDQCDGNSVNVNRIITLINTVAAMIRVDLRESRLPPGGMKGGSNKGWKDKMDPKLQFKKSVNIVKNSVVTVAGAAGVKIGSGEIQSKVHSAFWVENDDYGEPPLYQLLNSEEVDMYSQLSSSQRVVMSTTLLLKEFASKTNTVAAATFEKHVEDATQAWRGCSRIIDSPMPYSYSHLFHLMLFVTFVFGTPIAIMCNEATGWWGIGLCVFAPFLTYGLEEMAAEIENPFGWDANDHDLSRFCLSLNKEAEMLQKIA